MKVRKFYCHCCGNTFDEPDGMFEKLRCPSCGAIREDDENEFIEEVEEE